MAVKQTYFIYLFRVVVTLFLLLIAGTEDHLP